MILRGLRVFPMNTSSDAGGEIPAYAGMTGWRPEWREYVVGRRRGDSRLRGNDGRAAGMT